VVVRNGDQTAIVHVQKQSDEALFAPITGVRLLAGAAECAYVADPDVDTALPGALARAALTHAPDKRGVVVQGRYGHVSFIIDPAPLQISVHDVVPPYPAKLCDQVRRLLDVAEDLPPIDVVAHTVELAELARSRPSLSYLLPCRGGGFSVAGTRTAYLDERPQRESWILIGCERSQQIHEYCYGTRADQVDLCPRHRPRTAGPGLTKCCLLEEHIEHDDGWVVVPWGASLAQIREALDVLVNIWEPSWAPG
jgi:hypothetical protein